jgi:hypothetical protein
MPLFDDLLANMKNESALPGLVEKIIALPMEIKLTDAQVDHLCNRLLFLGEGMTGVTLAEITERQKHVFPIIMPVIPHFKMSKKKYDKLLSFILSAAIRNKDAGVQTMCISCLPPAFCPGGKLAYYLFVRAFLNGDAEEMEKYLHETVVQNLDTGNYDNDKALTGYLQRDELIQGRVDEVKALYKTHAKNTGRS